MSNAGKNIRIQVFEISLPDDSESRFNLAAITPYEIVNRTEIEAWNALRKLVAMLEDMGGESRDKRMTSCALFLRKLAFPFC